MENKDFYLTEREVEILELLTKGTNVADIAAKLFISHRTVTTHRQHIYRKTGCSSSEELIIYALYYKFVTVDELAANYAAKWKVVNKK